MNEKARAYGVVIDVFLKKDKAMPAFNEIPRSDSLPAQHFKPTVLLVDDDAKDLDYFSSLLKLKGYSVEAIASHHEAEIRLEHGGFDLVILSHGRAVLEARRLMRKTLQRDRCTPVVVITRCVEMEYYIEAMQLGAADFVEKPLSPVELERLVAKYCRPKERESSVLGS